jgi:hypothetical protein
MVNLRPGRTISKSWSSLAKLRFPTSKPALGRLNHSAFVIPLRRHFLSRLGDRVDQKQHKAQSITLSNQEIEDLRIWAQFLNAAHLGLSMNCIIIQQPTCHLNELSCHPDSCMTPHHYLPRQHPLPCLPTPKRGSQCGCRPPLFCRPRQRQTHWLRTTRRTSYSPNHFTNSYLHRYWKILPSPLSRPKFYLGRVRHCKSLNPL